MIIDYDEVQAVADAMQKRGGRFVVFLGAALGCADAENAEKIKTAFPEYWEKYLEVSKTLKKNAKNT